ncbi:MAG: hypothetical protein K0R54_809 [Clostridiaceae bacterium]|jgi:hypothetical protein|nr:hypothetical protein [Clostridiaceae bacterium]
MIRPINADDVKKNIANLLNEVGTTLTDSEFKNMLMKCIDNTPMCELSDIENIVEYYKNGQLN